MYDPKFSVKQMYDQYGSSRTKKADPKPSKSSGFGGMGPDPAERFGGSPTRGLGSKPDYSSSAYDSGGADNNPNRDAAESMGVVKKVLDRAVTRFRKFGASEPEDVIVDGKRVYKGPLFRGFDPTTSIGNFGGESGKKQYLLGMPILGEVTKSPTPPTLPPADTNPILNMFGVTRGFARDPSPFLPPDPMVQPKEPEGLMGVPRGLAKAYARPMTAAYEIQSGDTLSEIAKATGTTVNELADLNQISDVDVIEAGADIQIPIKRLEDKEIVTQASSMEELKPIKASYTISEPSLQLENTDPDAKNYQSFRQGITPIELMRTTGDDTYVSADYMSELEILARTIQAEAGGESKEGKLAVGAVIKNRADQNRFGNDIRSVILFPSQFSPWNTYTGSQGGEQGKDMLGGKMKPSKDSYDAARKILSGDYVDPTFGASHFVNPKISKPKWYKGFKKNGTIKIGKHEFGDADKVLFTGNVPPPMKSIRPKVRPLGMPEGTDI